MSAPMISGENVRCAILLILSHLAMLKMIPVLKTPFKHGEPHGELSLMRRYRNWLFSSLKRVSSGVPGPFLQ